MAGSQMTATMGLGQWNLLASTSFAAGGRMRSSDEDELPYRIKAGSDVGGEGSKASNVEGNGARMEKDEQGSSESESSTDDSDEESSDSTVSSESSDRDSTISSTDDQLRRNPGYTSFIQEAQLSPDGTCILASDFDRKFSVYVIDADILEADQSPRTLAPYASFCSTDPIWAFAASPSFSLNDARTTHVLTSSRDQYISLHNVIWDVTGRSYNPSGAQTGPLDISYKLASYKLIDHLTEAVEAPLSLAYTTDGDAFAAGTKNQIAIFDVNYTDDPVLKIRTIPSARSKLKDGGVGFKGMASALSISRSRRVLAAGTRTRHVGLYDHEGSGEQITQFSLPGTRNRNRMATEELLEMEGLIGNGITQLKWSPCGKYLYIAERDNDALWIYDVRNFSYALGTCGGRNARGNMKMGFDVWFDPANDRGGHQIWAGDVDGHVQIWNDPHLREGTVGPDDVRVVGKGPVSNTLVHPTGSLVIAASGSVEAGEAGELKGKGNVRGGIDRPLVRDGGSLDIFGLTG